MAGETVGQARIRVTPDTRGFEQSLRQSVSKSLNQVGRSVQAAGATLTKAVTVPIIGAGVAVAKMGSEFDREMSKITGLVGVSQTQVDDWSKQLLRLGPEVGKSPKELAEALFFVTSAGIKGSEALDVLEASAKASAAGLGDTATIADLVTSAVNAYGSETLSAANATDVLIGAVREGKAEAPELAASLGFVLPIASELGITFDQVGAAVAAMTRTGSDAASATTQLKAIMTSFIKPAKQAEDTLKEYGLSAAGLRQQIAEEGLLAALQTLRERVGDNQEAMGKIFPNVRALAGFLDLMGANAEETEAIFAAMSDTTGSLDAAFGAASSTIEFQFEQAVAGAQAAIVTLWDTMKPFASQFLTQFNATITDLIDRWNEMSPAARTFAFQLAGIAAAIGPTLVAVGTLLRALSGLALLLSPAGLIVAGVTALVVGLGLAAAKTDVLDGAMDTVRASLGQFVEGFHTGNTEIDRFGRTVETSSTFASRFGATMRDIFENVKTFFDALFNGNTEIDRFGRTVASSNSTAAQFAQTIRDVVASIRDAIERAFPVVRDVVVRVFRAIASFAREIWPQVLEIIRSVVQLIVAVVQKNVGIIQRFWAKWGDLIMRVARIAWDTIKEVIRAALKIIDGIIDAATAAIRGDWSGFWDAIKRILRGAWDLIFGIVRGAGRTVLAIFLNWMRTLRQRWNDYWAGVRKSAGNALQAIVRSARSARDGIGSAFAAMQSRVAAPINWIITRVINGGIIRAWNRLVGALGFDNLKVGDVGTIATRGSTGRSRSGVQANTGGAIFGPRGIDRIPAWLTHGEHVWTAEEVRALGGHRAVFALREAALLTKKGLRPDQLLDVIRRGFVPPTGGDPTFQRGGSVGRFARGGIVAARNFARAQHGKPYIWGGIGPRGYDCSGFQSAILNVLEGKAPHARRFTTASIKPDKSLKSGLGPRAGYSIGSYRGSPGHMAGTLGGTNVEAGGSPSRTKFSTGASGASHSRFNMKFHAAKGGLLESIKSLLGRIVSPIFNAARSAVDGRLGGVLAGLGKGMITKVQDAIFNPKSMEKRTENELGSFQSGGAIPRTGSAFVHRGETILSLLQSQRLYDLLRALERLTSARVTASGGGTYVIQLSIGGRQFEELWLDTGRKVVQNKGGGRVQAVLGRG